VLKFSVEIFDETNDKALRISREVVNALVEARDALCGGVVTDNANHTEFWRYDNWSERKNKPTAELLDKDRVIVARWVLEPQEE
jgi:hypothetical protein